MHPLHDYIAKQLAERLKNRKVVVWYDVRGEFAPFVAELRGNAETCGAVASVLISGQATRLIEYKGSFFEIRAAVEPFVSSGEPEAMLIYVPGVERDRRGSVLMELEMAGDCYEPQLKRLARNVLEKKYTLGQIDPLLNRAGVSYEDLCFALSDGNPAEPPSILKAIFQGLSGHDAILVPGLPKTAKMRLSKPKTRVVNWRNSSAPGLALKWKRASACQSFVPLPCVLYWRVSLRLI